MNARDTDSAKSLSRMLIKKNSTFTAGFSLDLFGVHPSGCQPSSSTLKRGHRNAALPAEPESFNSRTRLSALLFVALASASLLWLYPASASAQGGVPLWTNRYPAGVASAIAVDSTGNVFVTGTSWNGNDYATIKYSNTGVPLWTNRYNGPGNSGDQAT